MWVTPALASHLHVGLSMLSCTELRWVPNAGVSQETESEYQVSCYVSEQVGTMTVVRGHLSQNLLLPQKEDSGVLRNMKD